MAEEKKTTEEELEPVSNAEEVPQEEAAQEVKKDEANPWEEKYNAERDAHLRIAAEYDNFRKRTAKEKESLYGDAKADTVKPFLAVLDNLERGVQQFEEGDPHRQGMELICKQFMEVLAGLGVTEIPALGEAFDPEKHNAVMHTEDESLGENVLAQVFQKGFKIGDKVVRFAMVQVAN